VSTGSPIWWLEHGKPTRQASLIVEPADGRIPPLTPEAIKLGEARDAKFHLHWEGNTLVVETTNFLGGKLGLLSHGGGTPYSDGLVLTERFTRVSENTLNYEAIVNDPKTYTKPWKISFPLHRDPNYQMVE
jgi:hypothetical protein